MSGQGDVPAVRVAAQEQMNPAPADPQEAVRRVTDGDAHLRVADLLERLVHRVLAGLEVSLVERGERIVEASDADVVVRRRQAQRLVHQDHGAGGAEGDLEACRPCPEVVVAEDRDLQIGPHAVDEVVELLHAALGGAEEHVVAVA